VRSGILFLSLIPLRDGKGEAMRAEDVRRSLGAFSQYLRDSTGVAERTVSAYTSDLRTFAAFLGEAALDAVEPADAGLIHSFVGWLRERERNAPATIRRKVVTLASYFRWRVKKGLSRSSPVEEAEIVVRLPKRLPRALARAHVAGLLRSRGGVTQSKSASETSLGVRLLLATGIRIGEMCSIDVADVMTDGSAIRIKGKGNRERTVFVGNARLRSAVAKLAAARSRMAGAASPLFLNRRGLRLTAQAFRLRLHRIAAERGIPGPITPHRLRHTAATLLIEEGVDIRFVQRLLGHASIATTEIYTKVVDSTLRAALDRADPLRHLQR
jgi:integrase/recombinase XerD